MTDDLKTELEWILAIHFSGNRMPHMSGDPRNRLSPGQKLRLDDAVQSIMEAIQAQEQSIVCNAEWGAYNDVLGWINTQHEKMISKGDLYDAVMEMRPKGCADIDAMLDRVRQEALDDAIAAVRKRAEELREPQCCGIGHYDGGYGPPECCGDPYFVMNDRDAVYAIRSLTKDVNDKPV